jgi:hypothetical protein
MARTPSINTPGSLNLRAFQQAIDNIRERMGALDNDVAAITLRAGQSTSTLGTTAGTIAALQAQLAALRAQVAALGTAVLVGASGSALGAPQIALYAEDGESIEGIPGPRGYTGLTGERGAALFIAGEDGTDGFGFPGPPGAAGLAGGSGSGSGSGQTIFITEDVSDDGAGVPLPDANKLPLAGGVLTGNVSLGTNVVAGGGGTRRAITLSSPDLTGAGLGVLSFYGPTANQGNNGNIEWYDAGNTGSASLRNAFIYSGSSGATANNRGSFMAFATKADGVSGGGGEAMRIDSAGNVGIGGTPNAYGASYTTLTLNNNVAAGVLDFNVSGVRQGSILGSTAEIRVSAITAIPLTLYTSNTERVRIDTNGDTIVGTGATTGRNYLRNLTTTNDLYFGQSAGTIFGVAAGAIGVLVQNAAQPLGVGTLGASALILGTNLTERMRIDSAGLVGIGATPLTKLDIGTTADAVNTITVRAALAGVSSIKLNAYTFAVLTLTSNNSGSADAGIPTGTVGVGTGQAVALVLSTNGVERMRIDAAGLVGIGGASIGAKLYVTGAFGPTLAAAGFTVRDTGTSTNRLSIAANTNGAYIFAGGSVANPDIIIANNDGTQEIARFPAAGNFQVGPGGGVASKMRTQVWSTHYTDFGQDATYIGYINVVENSGAGIFEIRRNGTASMRIDAAGLVGIGRTPANARTLDIQAAQASTRLTSSTGTNSAFLEVANTGGSSFFGRDDSAGAVFGAGAYATALWASGAYPIALFTNSVERMRIDASGNIGIGIGPTYQFDASFASSPVLRWSSASGAQAYIQANSNVDVKFGSFSNNPLLLMVNATERARIDASGNVLIGTTAATEKLTVWQGNAYVLRTGGAKLRLADQFNEVSFESVPTGSSSDAIFKTNSVERMRIMASGPVVVNGTTNVGYGSGADQLAVNGTIGFNAQLNATPGAGNYLEIVNRSTGGLKVYTNAGAVVALDIVAAGGAKFGYALGMNGKTPVANVAAPAAATDLATVITLANDLRTRMINFGIYT